MTFSILVAPVLCSAFFRKGVREPRNRVMEFLTNALSQPPALGHPSIVGSRLASV